MDRQLTLGSLFSGSCGFELGGSLVGIKPLWASEVEPFAVAVTRKNFPEVLHLGDINKINGATVPPVDIITGGFCCQDVSVAGKRGGLHSSRSGLFFQMTRIVREMLEATNYESPKWLVVENVPGLLSSAKGADFREVMDEIASLGFIADPNILDAQEFGVAQRRKRVYIACLNRRFFNATDWNADDARYRDKRMRRALDDLANAASGGGETFAGVTSRYNEPQRQKLTEILETNVDGKYYLSEKACLGILRRAENRGKELPEILKIALETQAGLRGGDTRGDGALGFEPGACSRLGGHVWREHVGALRADAGDNQTAVVYDARGNGDGEVANTITGDHENRITDYTALVMNGRQRALTIGADVANTLTGTDYKGAQCLFEPKSAAFSGGQGSDAGSIAYNENIAPTIRGQAGGNAVPMVMTAFGICSQSSNSMKSGNPHSGVYEAETAKTLDTSVPDPNKNAGGMAIVAIEGNGARPSHRGTGVSEDGVSFTLNSVEKHAVCYQDRVGSLCASDFKFPQQQQIDGGKAVVEKVTFGNNGYGRWNGEPATLKSSGGDFPGGENVVVENRYVVRRLTPCECAKLQGFNPAWCADLGIGEPTETDIAFWAEVWETHRSIIGTSTKPKTRNQIMKWLSDPHSDAAEYKLWGNGICLGCAVFVLEGIVYNSRK